MNKTKLNYKKIFDKFRRNNIFVNLHYKPLHLNPFFRKNDFKKNNLLSENYSKSSLSIPIYFDLKKNEFQKVVLTIKYILKKIKIILGVTQFGLPYGIMNTLKN